MLIYSTVPDPIQETIRTVSELPADPVFYPRERTTQVDQYIDQPGAVENFLHPPFFPELGI